MNVGSAVTVILLGAAAIYSTYRRPELYPYTKGLPLVYLIGLIGSLALETGAEPLVLWVLLGLVLGLVGDLFLLKKRLFLYGLAAFLLGHVCYVIAFAQAGGIEFRPLVALPLAVFGAVISVLLFFHLWRSGRRHYLLPTLFYIVTICFMVIYGVDFDLDRFGILHAFGVGALLFAVSDALLSINRFVRPFATGQLVVLSSYYGAQLCIAAGVFLAI